MLDLEMPLQRLICYLARREAKTGQQALVTPRDIGTICDMMELRRASRLGLIVSTGEVHNGISRVPIYTLTDKGRDLARKADPAAKAWRNAPPKVMMAS